MSGTRAIRATGYIGPTSRFVGADISEDYRRRAIGNRAFAYIGGEAGIELQLANVILGNELSVISPLGETLDNRAPGLSGAQFISTLTFFLDWRVGGNSTSSSNTTAASTKPAPGGGTKDDKPNAAIPPSTPTPTPAPAEPAAATPAAVGPAAH